MIQMISALLAGAFLLPSFNRAPPSNNTFMPKIQHIAVASNATTHETIAKLGMCSAVLTDNG